MKKVYVFLAEGFEEIEAVTPIDLLRRAGALVTTLSITDSLTVTGARGVPFVADALLKECDCRDADLIVLPGGCPGFENLAASNEVIEVIKFMQSEGRLVSAICGAPAAVLGAHGFLKDYAAVCYPGMEDEMADAVMCDEDAVQDGNIVTGRAAGTAFAFGLKLVEAICGAQSAQKIATGVVSR